MKSDARCVRAEEARDVLRWRKARSKCWAETCCELDVKEVGLLELFLLWIVVAVELLDLAVPFGSWMLVLEPLGTS
jgi:hypothetical protein